MRLVALALAFLTFATISRAEERDGEALLGIVGGVTFLTFPALESRGWRVDDVLYGGLVLDWRHWFLGVDAEGYYGRGRARGNSMAGALQQFGGMGNLKLEIPITAGPIRLRPKAGLGYGVLSLNLTLESPTSNGLAGESRQTVHGAYAMGGLAVDLFEALTLHGDYAQSIFASADVEGDVSAFGFDLPTSGNEFDRLRLGLSLRLSRSVLLGGQYIERHIRTGVLGTVATPTQKHLGALLLLKL